MVVVVRWRTTRAVYCHDVLHNTRERDVLTFPRVA
jgi:hypothetical protein